MDRMDSSNKNGTSTLVEWNWVPSFIPRLLKINPRTTTFTDALHCDFSRKSIAGRSQKGEHIRRRPSVHRGSRRLYKHDNRGNRDVADLLAEGSNQINTREDALADFAWNLSAEGLLSGTRSGNCVNRIVISKMYIAKPVTARIFRLCHSGAGQTTAFPSPSLRVPRELVLANSLVFPVLMS